jgi:hypothetical protein
MTSKAVGYLRNCGKEGLRQAIFPTPAKKRAGFADPGEIHALWLKQRWAMPPSLDTPGARQLEQARQERGHFSVTVHTGTREGIRNRIGRGLRLEMEKAVTLVML